LTDLQLRILTIVGERPGITTDALLDELGISLEELSSAATPLGEAGLLFATVALGIPGYSGVPGYSAPGVLELTPEGRNALSAAEESR
jgi:hypothetical protein